MRKTESFQGNGTESDPVGNQPQPGKAQEKDKAIANGGRRTTSDWRALAAYFARQRGCE